MISNYNSNKSLNYPNSLFYILGLIFIFSVAEYLFEGLRYIQYFLSIILILFFSKRFPKSGSNVNYFYIIFLFFLFLILRGFISSNYIPYIFHDIYVWSFCIFILFFNTSNSLVFYKAKIPELFAKLLYFALPITIILFFLFGNFGSEITDRQLLSGNINDKAIYHPLLLAPLLMPFVPHFHKKLGYLVVISTFTLFIFGVFSATRSIVIVSLFGFIALVYQYKKNLSKFLFFISFIILLFYTLSQFITEDISPFFDSKFEYLISRFLSGENITSGRDSELKGLFEEFSPTEFLLGRGAGGSQEFGFWKQVGTVGNLGIPFTHFGFLNLILKGGFPLLIFVYGMALRSMIILWRKGEKDYSFVILIFLISEISHTKFNDPFYMIFLWTSISYSLKISS